MFSGLSHLGIRRLAAKVSTSPLFLIGVQPSAQEAITPSTHLRPGTSTGLHANFLLINYTIMYIFRKSSSNEGNFYPSSEENVCKLQFTIARIV